MSENKLIKFEDEQINRINKYAEERKTSFTQAVRILVEIGLKSDDIDNVEGESDSVDLITIEKRLKKLEEDREWWNTDDIQSRIGNIEVEQKEQKKSINVLTKVSKLFKAHINNREIHLQDS